jgi:hypothetical protein
VALPISAFAQFIEIKGLQIGMTKAEVQEKFPTWKDFTIAGVRRKYENSPPIRFRDEKLESLDFYFNVGSFETVLGAVKEKYPEIKCETSEVGNAMGAKFEQVYCSISDSESVLELSRYVSDIDTSALNLISKKFLDDLAKKNKQQKKDI